MLEVALVAGISPLSTYKRAYTQLISYPYCICLAGNPDLNDVRPNRQLTNDND